MNSVESNSKLPSVSQSAATADDAGVSLVRLYVLRTMYLLLVVGGGLEFLPPLIHHDPNARGVIASMLGAVWLLSCIGLRYPLQMLPVLFFELVWKTIWVLDFGLWQRLAGMNTPQFNDDFKAIAYAPLIFAAVIPWGYVWRHYVRKPGSRWSNAR
jgi:hypothetical protein